MYYTKGNFNKLPIIILILGIGIADAIIPGNWILSVAIPVVLAYASFCAGMTRIPLPIKMKAAGILLNLVFLFFTFNFRFYLLNLFLISLLIWDLATPFISRFKANFPLTVALLLVASFVIPYYKLNVPLLFLLYYPFYMVGFITNKVKLVINRYLVLYSIAGILGSITALFFIFTICLDLRTSQGLVYVTSLYKYSSAFLYSPLIVICFLIFGTSAIILRGKLSLSTNAALEEAVAENELPEMRLNEVFLRCFGALALILLMTVSVEFLIRDYSILKTVFFMNTPPFAYEFIIVGLIYLFFVFLLGRFNGTVLVFLGFLLFFTANFIKITFFKEPFYPWDIFLIGDAWIISKGYVTLPVIIGIAAAVIVMVAAIILNRKKLLKLIKPSPKPVLALITAVALGFNSYLLKTNSLTSVDVYKNWFDSAEEFYRNGSYLGEYFYIRDLAKYSTSKPSGYSETAMKQIKQEYSQTTKAKSKKPNVIVILSETFWDPYNLKGIDINRPVADNLNKYKNCTLISPRFGGGTANIEFELLTGLTSSFFNNGIVPYNLYVKRQTPGLVKAFKDNGYSAFAVHPNNGDMYNRDKVYKHFGFDKYIDISGFDYYKDKKGNHVSDSKFIEKVINLINSSKDKPLFLFGISMQNHDPYTSDVKGYIDREIQVSSGILDEVQKDMLSNFAQGVYDADKALGKLLDAAKESDRPTLIYYFGDHLPRLGVPRDIYDIYKKLNYVDGSIDPLTDRRFYETPLVVWSNYTEIPAYNQLLSPNQLAVDIMIKAGIEYPSYFNFLLDLRTHYPYLNNYMQSMDTLMKNEIIRKYYLIQYDTLFGRQYLGK